jgi:hypothetical protein
MTEIIKKKRGRKPKNLINNININIEKNIATKEEKTEEENIILHLPITLNDIINYDTNNISLFIKPENINNKIEDSDTTNTCTVNIKNKDKILRSESNFSPVMSNKITCNNVNKINTHNLIFNNNIKCWWCKNLFDMPPVQLPEDYYNNTFYCIGHFCSFNCTKSYNLDLNDIFLWKRESLLNLLYFLTYSEYKYIEPSPHWLILEEFGGILSINDFRYNSIINIKDYLILHPPLISRQIQIEESYKINKLREVPIDKLNKIYSDINTDYMIKRNKPINNAYLNLETTMGLIKK